MKARKLPLLLLTGAMSLSVFLSAPAHAADYDIPGVTGADFYPSTEYAATYGSAYLYGGTNAADFLPSPLPYGITEEAVSPERGGYGVYPVATADDFASLSSAGTVIPSAVIQRTAFTPASEVTRSDGSLGTLKIPILKIEMKVWEGETAESMKKGLGHYSSSSAWDGNVCLCGHNRGAKFTIGGIKDLKKGDTILYTTSKGTREYAVDFVKIIPNNDWSYLGETADHRITITTCLADHPESRVVVQAKLCEN